MNWRTATVRRNRLLTIATAGWRPSRSDAIGHADRRLLTSIVEYAEGGDYFNFIRKVQDELRAVFTSLKVVRVGKQAAWYVCGARRGACPRLSADVYDLRPLPALERRGDVLSLVPV